MTPLPKPSVDTGMGLERISAVMQGVASNYDIDLFKKLIRAAGKLAGTQVFTSSSLRVIADHIRAATFLVVDGVSPSNEGRGYVLRRIIRRAIRHGYKLGIQQPFFYKLVPVLEEEMGAAYPELVRGRAHAERVLKQEEERFAETLANGMVLLEGAIRSLRGAKLIDGDTVFKLYDTYGFPVDLTADIARERGLSIDQARFDAAMDEQRRRSQEASKFGVDLRADTTVDSRTLFQGYERLKASGRIVALLKDGAPVETLKAGEQGEVVLDRTPFYAESGGQIADTGTLWNNERTLELAEVRGAYYPVTGLIAHRVMAQETLRVGDRVAGEADTVRRERNKRNHTATHLMHAALRNILGTHVKQAGSLVAPDRLRFDFSHFAPVDPAELTDIEQQVNDHIRQNSAIETDITTLDDALASGALAFFGDRYPEQNVRVVTIPDPGSPRGFYSKELCGGTHVKRSGDIGVFKIAVEQSVASGIRRIEALTGEGALADYQRSRQLLAEVAARLHVGEHEVNEALERLAQAQKQIEKQLEASQRKTAIGKLDALLEHKRTVKDVAVLAAQVEGLTREGLRELVDPLRQKMGPGVFVLAAVEDGSVALLSSVTRDLTNRLHAGRIIQSVAKDLGGKGGGRPDLAEAGGKDTSNLKSALDRVYTLVEGMLASQ